MCVKFILGYVRLNARARVRVCERERAHPIRCHGMSLDPLLDNDVDEKIGVLNLQ